MKKIVVIVVVVVLIAVAVVGVVAQPYRIYPAYINEVAIKAKVDETMPMKYYLRVRAGGPTTCWRPWRYCVMRFGNIIFVSVLTLHHRYKSCGQAFTWEFKVIPLGSCLIPGMKYTVVVNDAVKTFVAIGG
jgi:hypothetical protein